MLAAEQQQPMTVFLGADLHNASIATIVAHVLCKHAACTSRHLDKEMQKERLHTTYLGLRHGGVTAGRSGSEMQMKTFAQPGSGGLSG